jgi:hypothetical protein
MNPDYEKQLELEISRELNRLPELKAPDSLVTRVLATLERRAAEPRYQPAWQTWPTGLRWASLLFLLLLFGGLCLAGWKLSHAEIVTLTSHRIGTWFSALNTLGHTVDVLLGSAVLVLKHLGVGFMIACLVSLGLGYAICLGLGTVYARIALAASAPAKQQ